MNKGTLKGVGRGLSVTNSSISVGDSPPPGAQTGDTWYESDTGKTFVYYDSYWVETGATTVGPTGPSSNVIGEITNYAGSSVPSGWLKCDGTAVPIATYNDLYQVIGTTYGAGNGTTTFNLPTMYGTTGMYIIRWSNAGITVKTDSLYSANVGSMMQWPITTSLPTGWVLCDGSAYTQTSYPDLYAIIGTTYGNGTTAPTGPTYPSGAFNVPNLAAAGAGAPSTIIKAVLSGTTEPGTIAHASNHVRGGNDVIDGDRLQVDYVPTAYIRDSSDGNAGQNTDLTAHLKGLDTISGVANQGHRILTTTQKTALGSVTTGTQVYDSTLGQQQLYNGTTWVPVGGLQWLNTTTLTGTSVSINNVFSSTYTNYRIVVRGALSSAADFQIRMRASSTDATTSYTWQVLTADSTTITAARNTSQTFISIGYHSNTVAKGIYVVDVASPALAEPTMTSSYSSSAYLGAYIRINAGLHDVSTSYDGFTIFSTSGQTMTGEVRVYGYINS